MMFRQILKEGKWEDFAKDSTNILKRLEDFEQEYQRRKSSILADSVKMNYKLNEELKEEISYCMVDLEDHLRNYTPEPKSDNVLCFYEYTIPQNSFGVLLDVINKLDEHIGKNTYTFEYCNRNYTSYPENDLYLDGFVKKFKFPMYIEFNFKSLTPDNIKKMS